MNVNSLLLAIAMVETGNDPGKVGSNLEVTQYQITPRVWKMHTDIPLSKRTKEVVREVARKHVDHIRRQLPYPMCNAPFWIAVAWNGGTGFANRAIKAGSKGNPVDHVANTVRDYAFRVQALYYEYEKNSGQVRGTKGQGK